MGTRSWKWLKGRGKTNRATKRPDPARLGLVELESRTAPAVVAVLQPGGLLDVGFDAEGDTATISGGGGQVVVTAGGVQTTFSASSVTGLTAHGDTNPNQALTITGGLTLANALTVTGLEQVTIQSATITAPGADVLATGPVTVAASALTATGPVTISSAVVAGGGGTGRGTFTLGTVFNADAAVVVTDSVIKGSNVTVTAAAAVVATAAGDQSEDTTNRDFARVATKANARVEVGGTSRIEAPGFVTLSADADNTTTSTALAQATSNDPNRDAAVAFSNLGTSATVDLTGSAAVAAGGAVTLAATNDAAATTTADGSAGGSAAVGGSVARAVLDSVTRAAVAGGASVSGADVAITATSGSKLATTARSTTGGSTANDADTQQQLAESGAKTADGSIGLAGAFAVNKLARHDTQAFVATAGSVTAANTVRVAATSTADASAVADGSVTGSSDTVPPVGVGVAVAIDRGAVSNRAFLGGAGTVGGKAVSVEAVMPAASDFAAAATAGAGAKNVGVAGAFALNAVDTASEAFVAGGAAVNLAGADLTLTATGATTNAVTAAPTGVGGTDTKFGVGASAALNTITRTTRAEVEGNATITGANNLTLGATGSHATDTSATTGAEGGFAATPGVALSLVTNTSTARIGAGAPLSVAGGVTLSAADTGATTAKASGTATGGQVAAGASLGLVRVTDAADATIGRGLTAGGNVTVTANTASTSKADGAAGAKGTASTATSDQQIDQQAADPNRPGAATSKGQVGAAAALGINLPTARSVAAIGTGVSVTAGGTVTLDVANTTTAAAKADGSATVPTSALGVGVAVGINAAKVENEARLDPSASVKAAGLTLHAGTPAPHAFTAEAVSGAGAKTVGVAGSFALNKITNGSQAVFKPGATADVTGAVTLAADGQSTGTTAASPAAGGATGETLGIGASVALGVFANTVRAELEDQSRLVNAGTADVTATANHTLTTNAQGGAGSTDSAGAFAVTPVVGITVATNTTAARVGRADAGPSAVAGALRVEAAHTAAATTTAAGSAVATKVGLGVALALDIANDKATALVGRAKAGGPVTVRATSAAASTADAKASARGGPTASGQTVDQSVDQERGFADTTAGTSTPAAPSAKAPDGGVAGQPNGAVAVAAAVGVNLGRSNTRAGIEDGGFVESAGFVTVSAGHNADSAAKADGSTVAGDAPPPQGVGVAAAVAINAATASAEAAVGTNAGMNVRGAKLETFTKAVGTDAVSTSAATANSGAGATNVGVAGSLAIDVADHTSTAAVRPRAVVTVGTGSAADDLTLSAANTTANTATATATIPGGSKVGVGGSFALVVAGNTTKAAVETDAILFGANDLSLTSAGTHSQTATTTAGSAGGTAVSPSVALVVGLGDTSATVAAGPLTILSGSASVTTAHVSTSATKTSADAAGKSTAVGATVALTIADDTTAAATARSLTAGGAVTVLAQNDATTDADAKASANGGSEQQAGDEIADRFRAYGQEVKASLSGSGSIGAKLRAELDKAKLKVQEFAGASSDSVGVAGAVGVNVALADTAALIGAGTTVSAGGAVTVRTAADADQDADAVGIAGGLSTGTAVGAALALNVAVTKNRAEIGAGAVVSATGITVDADQPAADDRQATAQALGGGGAKKSGVAGSLAVNIVSDETKALVAAGAALTSKAAVAVEAESDLRLQAVAGGAAVGVQNHAVGAGVAVNVVVEDTRAFLDANSTTDAAAGITVLADSALAPVNGSIPNDPMAAAVGGDLSSDTGFAGSAAVNVITETTHAFVAGGARVNPTGALGGATQSVTVRAVTDNTLTSAAGVAQGGIGATQFGLGATVTVLTHDTAAFVAPGAAVRAGGDVTVEATSEEDAKSFAAAIGGSTTNQVSGSVAVYVPVTKTRAFFDGSSTGESNGNTRVTAKHDADIRTLAGNGAGAGSNSIGGAFSVVVTRDTVDAYVGPSAKLTARGATGLTVEAIDVTAVRPRAVAGSGAGGAGIAGSATVTNLNPTTTAHIDGAAQVTAANAAAGVDPSVRVAATATTTLIGVAGAAAGGGSGGFGAGADAADVDKLTQAWVARGAVVTADRDVAVLADSKEDVTSVTGSAGGGGSTGLAGAAGVLSLGVTTRAALGETPGVFASGAATQVTADGNVIVAADDRADVDVIAGTAAGAGGTGFGGSAAVPVVKKTTEAYVAPFAVVQANGKGAAGTTARTGKFTVTTGGDDSLLANEVHLPDLAATDSDGDGLNDLTDSTLTGQRTAAPQTAAVRGLAVTATSVDDVETIAVGAAGSGGLAIGVGAPVTVISPVTRAFVGGSAKVNGANGSADPGQSVLVAAGSDVYFLGIGGAATGSGGAAVGPAAAVAVISPTTEAEVRGSAQVAAAQLVTVQADATQDAVMVAAGAAGGGATGIAGAVSVLKLLSATKANVGGSAAVTAGDTVSVTARDHSDLDLIAGSAGIGLGVGVGGSAGVVLVEKDTKALVSGSAVVEGRALGTGVTLPLRGVVIAANSKEEVLNVAAAGAGGFGGVAGGIGVTVVDSDTEARVGAGAKVNPTATGAGAAQGVSVTATNVADVLSVGGGLAIGVGALGGGVDVGSLRNDTAAAIDASAAVRATGDVSVIADSTRDVRSVALSGSAGAVGLNASVSVWAVGVPFSSTYTNGDGTTGVSDDALDDGSGTGANQFADQHAGNQAGTAHDRVTDRLDAFNSSTVDLTGQPQTPVQRLGQAVRAGRLDLTGLPTSSTVTGGLNTAAAQPGTTALVAAGASVTAGDDVTVAARDDMDVEQLAGGTSVGGAAVGASVAVLNTASKTDATVSGVIDAAGDVTVQADFEFQDVDSDAVSGKAGLIGLGASVSVVKDTSTQRARLGGTADVQRAAKLQVVAEATQNISAETGSLAVTGLQAGASYARAIADGSTKAAIDGGAKVGQAAKKTVADVAVTANSNIDADADADALSVGVLGSADVNFTRAEVTPEVAAEVKPGALVAATNDVTVTARSDGEATADTQGATLAGGASLAVNRATARSVPATTARIDNAAVTAGRNLTLLADAAASRAIADAEGSAGGVLVSASGSKAIADALPLVTAEVRSAVEGLTTVTAGNDVAVKANAVAFADADADNNTVGLIAIGAALATATAHPTLTASVGGGSAVLVTAGHDVLVESKAATTADADTESAGTALVPQSTANGAATATLTTLAAAGANAVLTAGNLVTVRSVLDAAGAAVTARADGHGIGGGSDADATANVGQGGSNRAQLTTEIDGQATVEAPRVVLSAVAESETVSADSDALDTGASRDGNTNAFARADVAVTAKVLLETGARVTGTESVDIDARHDAASNTAHAFADDFAGAIGTAATTRANQVTDAFVTAQDNSFVTARSLAVDVRHTPTALSSVAIREAIGEDNTGDQFRAIVPARTITWNATTTVLGAPDPELVIDAAGNVTKAVGVTIADSDGVTLGPVASTAVVVNPITYPAPAEQVKFTANRVTAFGNTVGGVIGGSTGAVNYVRTPGKVTVTNRSAKPLTVGSVNVIGTGQPGAVLNADDVTIGFTSEHLYPPTEVTVQNLGPAGGPALTLTGAVTNPVGRTRVVNERGNVTFGSAGLVETRDFTLSAPAGSAGSSSAPVRVNLVQSDTRSTDISASASGNLVLQLAGRQRRTLATGTPFTVRVDSLQAGGTLDLRLADGLVQTTVTAAHPTSLVREVTTSTTTTVVSHFRPLSEEFPPPLPLGVFGTGTATTDTAFVVGSATAGGSLTVSDVGSRQMTISGPLSAGGALTFSGVPAYGFTINGTTPGTGFVTSSGSSVNLNGAVLKVTAPVATPVGTKFTVISNTGTAAVNGTFAGLPEGTEFQVGDLRYAVSYAGGDGNDVVLTRTNTPSMFTERRISATDEGGYAVLHGVPVDPDPTDTFRLVIDWGDGTTEERLYPPGTTEVAVRHRYRDNRPGDQPYEVKLDWRDQHGGGNTGTLLAAVTNVAPRVQIGPARNAAVGEAVPFTAAITDPGVDDTHTVTWVVRDEAGNTIGRRASGTTFTFTPTAPGRYTVTATATDDDGGVGTETATVFVR